MCCCHALAVLQSPSVFGPTDATCPTISSLVASHSIVHTMARMSHINLNVKLPCVFQNVVKCSSSAVHVTHLIAALGPGLVVPCRQLIFDVPLQSQSLACPTATTTGPFTRNLLALLSPLSHQYTNYTVATLITYI
jgi:hypothetical protein